MDGDTVREVQLKAVLSADAIYKHLARYPEIEVMATGEVASQVPGVEASGFLNSDLTDSVNSAFLELPGDSVVQEMAEGIATSALVSSAIAAGRMLRAGQMTSQQFRSILGDVTVGAVTATSLEVLLGGIS